MAGDGERILDLPAAERHFWLTQGMARTAGVNLTTAIADGRLARADLARMVVACASCQSSERCVRWMAEGTHLGAPPPAYCLNHETISALLARS